MKNLNLLSSLFFIACISACSSNVDEELIQSREISKQLGAQLKGKLISAMQSAGAEAAIAVCNLEAINITANVSKNKNLEVGRTSLKIRNSSNQPDVWEIKQLKSFEAQNNSGADINSLETHEIVTEDGRKVFRYLKAIPIQEPCMLCHGTKLTAALDDKIKSLYPQDQATGYKLGQIRGAFTIKKPH